MSLSIHPMTAADIPDYVDIICSSFGPSIWTKAQFPDGLSLATQTAFAEHETKNLSKRNLYSLCARDDATGDIVAIARWRLEDELTLAEVEEDGNVPGGNDEAQELFHGMIAVARNEIMGKKTYWHLKVLATSPHHQRRGAGQLLLTWGTSRAEAAGLECYLDSSAAGKILYERAGFEVLKTSSADLSRFGVDAVGYSYGMVRRPVGGKGKEEGKGVGEA